MSRREIAGWAARKTQYAAIGVSRSTHPRDRPEPSCRFLEHFGGSRDCRWPRISRFPSMPRRLLWNRSAALEEVGGFAVPVERDDDCMSSRRRRFNWQPSGDREATSTFTHLPSLALIKINKESDSNPGSLYSRFLASRHLFSQVSFFFDRLVRFRNPDRCHGQGARLTKFPGDGIDELEASTGAESMHDDVDLTGCRGNRDRFRRSFLNVRTQQECFQSILFD